MKKYFCLLVLVCAFAATTEAQQDKKYGDSSQRLFHAGKYQEAIKMANKAITLNNRSDEHYRSRGLAELALNELPEARADYEQALKLNAQCSRCLTALGWIDYMQNNDAEALAKLDKAIAISDTDDDAYVRRALVKEHMKQVIGAERDLNKAVSLKPQNTDWLAARAQFHDRSGLHEDAIKDYDKAIAIKKDAAALYVLRAQSRFALQQYAECMSDLDKAKALHIEKEGIDNLNRWVETRARVYDATGKLEALADDLDFVLKTGLGNYNTYDLRASYRYKLEDMDGACDDMMKANGLFKNSAQYQPGGNAGMEQHIKEICDTNQASYYYQRGIALFNKRNYQQAISMYDRGLRKFKDHPLLYSFRGNANITLGNYKECLQDYAHSLAHSDKIQQDIGNATAYNNSDQGEGAKGFVVSNYDNMALAHMALGEFDIALKLLDSAAALQSRTPQAISAIATTRARYYLAQGDATTACKEADKAVAAFSNNADAFGVRAAGKLMGAMNKPARTYTLSGGGSYGNIVFPASEIASFKVKKDNNAALADALNDINKAIALNSKIGWSYYIRAFIKKAMGEPQWCIDLKTAVDLGYKEAEEVYRSGCK